MQGRLIEITVSSGPRHCAIQPHERELDLRGDTTSPWYERDAVSREPGSVIWITGLPGAGKTTVADEVAALLRERTPAVVQVDGDVVREVMGNDLGYTPEARLANAWRISRLCKMLSAQGLQVVCATVSLFSDIHEWNRKNLARYVEVYLRVSDATLAARNKKGLMRGANNVVGVNQSYDVPQSPDLVVDNEGSDPARALAERILAMAPRP
jgi:adenylylsulfate kinase-like enzyme